MNTHSLHQFVRTRRKLLPTLAVFLLISLLSRSTSTAQATSPYTTWALGPGGGGVLTQDAYRPIAEIDLPLEAAEDMFIAPTGFIYVADTGNARIVKLDPAFEIVATYGEDILGGPTGIYVDDAGMMYIADAKSETIVILDTEGQLVHQFGRPVEPLFGKQRDFLPRKIAVDARKNLYIISEGAVDGIVQMNINGNFIGYFGANTATMSLKMILQRMFLTEEQLAQFIKNEAASPTNIAIDPQSLVYTVTAGTDRYKSIRKFTISGKNIFPDVYDSTSFKDIHVSANGLVLAVDARGQIFEYDSNGALLYVFGAQDNGDQRLGTLRTPAAIERYGEHIFVLDRDKSAIVVYETTAFAQLVHTGVRLYMEGFYSEARPYFEEVLDYNGSFIMSYQAIADAHFKEGDYPAALAAYRYGEDRNGYSQAYWELRNQVLQQYLTTVILGLIGLSAASNVFKRIERRTHWLDPLRRWLRNLQRHKLVDDFVFMFRFIKYPGDSFYYIKKDQRGSLRFAFILYLWVVAVRVLTLYLTGFPFSPYTSVVYIPVENEIAYTLGLLFLWNAANYLISTISDGEGRVRDVIIGSAYSLFPYALFALPIALISNVLTLNEVFLFTFSTNLMWAWTGLMLFLMVQEIHNYSFWETVRNIFITLFTMALFILTGYVLYVLFNQLFDFVSAILQEVRLRG